VKAMFRIALSNQKCCSQILSFSNLIFRWNETGKSFDFLKIVANKFAYPDLRLNSETLGKSMTEFIEKYKEKFPSLLKKVKVPHLTPFSHQMLQLSQSTL
jgi:hypothetical protein